MKNQINQDVKQWLTQVAGLSDAVLDKKWEWQGYDEGIRFAFFRVLEELRALVTDEAVFPGSGNRNESASVQQYLVKFHQVYWDLRVLLAGMDESLFDKEPSANEWTPRRIIRHLMENEWGFYGIFRYGFQFAGVEHVWPEDSIPERFFDEHFDSFGQFSDDLFQYPINKLLDFFDEKHRYLLEDLAKIPDSELEKSLVFWEPEPKTARFRLIRFESHFRQHTIQMEKTIYRFVGQEKEVTKILRACMAAYADLDARLRFVKHDESYLKMVWESKVLPFMQIITEQSLS